MNRTSVAAVLLSAAAITAVAAPASADPLGDLFGSSGSADMGSSNLLDAGSSALGSSSDKPQHFGKLGRPDAPNGVKSINTWVYAPKTQPVGDNTYPKNSQLGVRWNSTIDAGPVIDGNECKMEIRITGPKIPAKAQLFKTQDCTATHTYLLRTPGAYGITVTDTISGASNAIKFNVA
ncbi:hypothetical protein AAFP30_19300 [Gordonia sp. CPCC 205515]|uniref:hypothetical protein n=1 Tax=Gordonia sp. CPCC 205515 TaxID=3140791 RepID=UPI003AF35B63